MTALGRQLRTDAADALCTAAFARALEVDGRTDAGGVALVAVGGYGRRELAPYSDLDVVLAHTDTVEPGAIADEVWYPLWDSGAAVDHAVRSLPEVTAAAKQDVRVALGLLDARHLAGDPSVTLRLRSALLAQWRRDARERLPELHDLARRRVERLGELAHATVPDLKESGGGLRDATILNALVATWLVDVPHVDLERSRRQLLDVRDALHTVAGRASERVGPDLWSDLADELAHDRAHPLAQVANDAGRGDAGHTQRHVREIGRRITHLSRLTWRRVDGVLAPRPRPQHRRRGPDLLRIGRGLAVAGGELVALPSAVTSTEPTLLLRAAAEAAERDLILSPTTAARLARECPDLPEPWPEEARELLVRLLAAGPALLAVWETLDETGGLARVLPEWERLRLLPHASVVHRFTVDRHLVETCIEASRLIRRVARPDLLLVAALLHDIGKGGLAEHSAAGEPIAADIARRMGFAEADVATLATLVRWHLLLAEVATTRDVEDPSTARVVASRLGGQETLDLLAVLTEADARATSAKAWTTWRAGLVAELVRRTTSSLADHRAPADGPQREEEVEIPAPVREGRAVVDVQVETGDEGSVVSVVAVDRLGLLAAIAATLAMDRVPVRAARAWTQDRFAVSRWHVDDRHLVAPVLRQRLEAVLEGRLDPRERLRPSTVRGLPPAVTVRPEASRQATVLEVRVVDHPGVVYRVCQALAGIGVTVRSAHVSTVGPQAVDVFYLQEESAGVLGDERAAAAAHAVRRALTDPATLDH